MRKRFEITSTRLSYRAGLRSYRHCTNVVCELTDNNGGYQHVSLIRTSYLCSWVLWPYARKVRPKIAAPQILQMCLVPYDDVERFVALCVRGQHQTANSPTDPWSNIGKTTACSRGVSESRTPLMIFWVCPCETGGKHLVFGCVPARPEEKIFEF